MIDKVEWRDKLPEDKAQYFNRQKKSLLLFAKLLGKSPSVIILEMKRQGYKYDENTRKFVPVD